MGGAQGPNAGKDATAVMRLRQVILLIGTAARVVAYAQQGLWSCRASVRLSVGRLSQSHNRQQQRWPAGLLFSAMRAEYINRQRRAPAPRSNWRHAQQQRGRSTAQSSKCGQCHVDSRGTRLNTVLSCFLTKWAKWSISNHYVLSFYVTSIHYCGSNFLTNFGDKIRTS